MPKALDVMWAGTQASYDEYLQAMVEAEAYIGKTPADEDPVPYLLDIQGNVGVVSIKGPLTNKDSWINQLVGVTSYNSIREAVIYAAQAPEVKQILLDIGSGGGDVNGVADAGNLISLVNDKIKPVTAYTDGTMASAAYWLGSSAGSVYASNTSTVGSIGVIATHKEQSKALKEAGIGVTVLRAGKYKGLVNGVEPLSEEAKAQIQEQLDEAYKVFVQHVAASRNVSYEIADTQMAQGREFFGVTAVAAGLVDGITSYDDLFNALSKEAIDSTANIVDNSKKPMLQEFGMRKKALSEAVIAAMAEGAAPIVTDDVDTDAAAPPVEVEGAVEAQESTQQAQAADAVEIAAEADTSVLDYLKGQLKEKDSDILAANVQIQGLKNDLDSIKAAQEGLLQIAVKSVSNMQVALGGAPINGEGMNVQAVLAEHARVSEAFSNKFKVGGVAAMSAPQPGKSEQAVDALTRARRNAVLQTKSK